jgi:hypothetical protein
VRYRGSEKPLRESTSIQVVTLTGTAGHAVVSRGTLGG